MIAGPRLEVTASEPFADGRSFGAVGPYERVSATARFAIDPSGAAGADVVDLGLASRNRDGLVEFESDVCIVRPRDARAGSGRLLFDVVNRGDKKLLSFFNDARESNSLRGPAVAGNGFLMRHGYTLVWAGWQGDVLPGDGRLTARLPLATEGGKVITGLIRKELINEEPGVSRLPLSGNVFTRSHPVASDRDASLTKRERAADSPVSLPRSAWSFPSDSEIEVGEGFQPGWIYDLAYEARDPLVMGLGFVIVRDLIAELRADPEMRIEKCYGWGRSQSGRFLRDFVYQGFNQDSRGQRVFDAIWPYVAGAGRIGLNQRFGQPGRFSRQHEDHGCYCDAFPFAYAPATDPSTGTPDAILKRPDTDPLVFHMDSSSEYWGRRASLTHTDLRGEDLPEPAGVRFYLMSGAQHQLALGASAEALGGPKFNRPQPAPANAVSPWQRAWTPLLTNSPKRALLLELDRWATDGTPPPASRMPTRAAGELVAAADALAGFPSIPGVKLPTGPNMLAGATVLVPAVDADGNERAGLKMPELQAALGTYSGWNVRAAGFGEGDMASLLGSWFPLDRGLIEMRYRDRAGYLRALAHAGADLVAAGFLLGEDLEAYLASKELLDLVDRVFS